MGKILRFTVGEPLMQCCAVLLCVAVCGCVVCVVVCWGVGGGVYASNTFPCVRSKRPPCVLAPRPHVLYMLAWCRCTHGDVLNLHTVFQRFTPHTPPPHKTQHTTHPHPHTTHTHILCSQMWSGACRSICLNTGKLTRSRLSED